MGAENLPIYISECILNAFNLQMHTWLDDTRTILFRIANLKPIEEIH